MLQKIFPPGGITILSTHFFFFKNTVLFEKLMITQVMDDVLLKKPNSTYM